VIRVASAIASLAVAAAGWGPDAAPVRQDAPLAPLVIERVEVQVPAGTLTVVGGPFGPRPLVTLDLVPLDTRQVTERTLAVSAPLVRMPPGRYLLTVSRGPAPGDTATTRIALHGADTERTPASDSASAPGTASALPAATDTAAVVGDRVISIAEVDREWQRTDPTGYLAESRRVYEARQRAVQRLVHAELIAREAAARGTTVEALLAEEIPKRRIPMPDVAVAAVYRSLGDRSRGVTLEALQPAIRAWLADVSEPELARLGLVEELMKVSTKAEVRLAAPETVVAVEAAEPASGPASAPAQLVVFGDLHSLEYATLARAFPRIRETFGARLRLVFKHLPSSSILSETASRAGACAHAQGRFWEFHDATVTTPGLLDTARLKRIAGEAGLARATFDACLDGEAFTDLAPRSIAEAARYAVQSSPALLMNGVLAPPAPAFLPPFEYLQRLIEEALARRAAKPGGR
jgi:protein-disulfide isomerase